MFLGAALATAGILFAIVATDGPNPLVPPRRVDRLATLGFFAFVVAGGIAVPGVVLTFFYLRRRYGWIRGSYRVLLFLTVVANVLIFTTDARVLGPAIVPTSLFIAVRLSCAMEQSNRCSVPQPTAPRFQESRCGSRQCPGCAG